VRRSKHSLKPNGNSHRHIVLSPTAQGDGQVKQPMPAVRRGSSKKGWSPVCRVQTGFHQRLFLEHTRAITAKLLGAKDIRNVAKFSPTTPENQSINQFI